MGLERKAVDRGWNSVQPYDFKVDHDLSAAFPYMTFTYLDMMRIVEEMRLNGEPAIMAPMAERYKDQDFYMTFVTLQVEDCLFRVPRHTLEAQSTVFRDMFSFPPPPDTEVEGSSDEHPIRLDGVAADEFRQLLKVLYPGPNGPDLRQGSEEWISVLKLSNMWQFQQVRTLALQKLPYKSVRKTAAEKVALAFQYDIEKWLLPGLNELARRQQPISVEDVQLLGLEVALKVAAVRESHVSQSPGIFGPPGAAPGPRVITGPRNARHVDFRPIIRKTFELPDNHPGGGSDANDDE